MKIKLKAGLFASVMAGSLAGVNAYAGERPNIIVIFVDDLGYNDLGYRNSSFETPNIDRLAKEGVDFINAYTPSPTSSPSRAALLTGRYPIELGITRHINEANPDPFGNGEYELLESDPGRIPNKTFLGNEVKTFATYLKENQYSTVAIGKWHLGQREHYPDCHGFQRMHGESDRGHPASYFPDYFQKMPGVKQKENGKYLTDYLTDCAVDEILDNDYSLNPLCLYLAHYGVHSPHMAPEKMVEKYIKSGMEKRYAIYHAMVESIDNSVGRILYAVEKAGQTDNTVIMFISDQGGFFTNAPLRGGKIAGALYEGGAKIPFIVKYPRMTGGSIVSSRINTLDVFPTILELAGIDVDSLENIDGQSLKNVLYGGDYVEKPIYFYRSYDDQPAAVLDNGFKLIWSRAGNHELYNLEADPNETENLSEDKRYSAIFRKMKKMLKNYLSEYEPNPVR